MSGMVAPAVVLCVALGSAPACAEARLARLTRLRASSRSPICSARATTERSRVRAASTSPLPGMASYSAVTCSAASAPIAVDSSAGIGRSRPLRLSAMNRGTENGPCSGEVGDTSTTASNP